MPPYADAYTGTDIMLDTGTERKVEHERILSATHIECQDPSSRFPSKFNWSKWRRSKWAAGAASLFSQFHHGFAVALQGPVMPVLKTAFSESSHNQVIAYWFVARALGGVMGSFAAGRCIKHGGGRAAFVGGLVLLALGALAIPFWSGAAILGLGYAMSFGIGMVCCCSTTFSSWAFDGDTRPINNYNIVAFAVGAAVSPSVAVYFQNTGDQRASLYVFWVLAGLVTVTCPFVAMVVPPRKPETLLDGSSTTVESPAHAESMSSTWWALVPASGLMLFFSVGGTAAFMNFLGVWANMNPHMSGAGLGPGAAEGWAVGSAVTVVAVIDGATRLALGYFNPDISAERGLVAGSLLTAVCALPMVHAPSETSMFVSAVLFGLALPVFEGFTIAGVQEKGLMTELAGSILSAGGLGSNLVSALVALLADRPHGSGIVTSIIACNLLCAAIGIVWCSVAMMMQDSTARDKAEMMEKSPGTCVTDEASCRDPLLVMPLIKTIE